MLMTQRAWTEGGRLRTTWLSLQLDVEHHHPDPVERERAGERLGLLTPVAKAFLSDNVFEVANLAVQIYGGHGYVTEHGVEQIVRDVRVFSIYEGANGIQALDLVGRKLLSDRGVRLGRLFDEIDVSLRGMEDLSQVRALRRLLGELRDVVVRRDVARANDVAAHILRALGPAALGWRLDRE